MDTLTCKHCHAELVPHTSFCRQCGAAIEQASVPAVDEGTTALLDQSEIAATRRLESRQTSPASSVKDAAPTKRARKKAILIASVVTLLVVVGVTSVAIRHSRNKTVSAEGLIYPESRELVNMVAEGGGRTLQLETADSLQKVEAWYRASMKPGKVIQLSPGSVVLKNEKATATIVREDNKTNILIKIVP